MLGAGLAFSRVGGPSHAWGAGEQAQGSPAQSDPEGLWVDTRTGSDFVQIKAGLEGFSFTAYGGSLAQPRYLSQGRAQEMGPQQWQATAQDLAGQCCGNQGRLAFRTLSKDRLEVRALWWPLNQPDSGEPLGEPYILERVEEGGEAASTAPAMSPAAEDKPSGQVKAGPETPAPAQASPTLLRLYNPRRLLHAYAVTETQVQALKAQGFELEGPLGQLLPGPAPDAVGLWAFRETRQGYTILQNSQSAPSGFEPLGLLGYVHAQAQPNTQPLYQLKGSFPEPLRGGKAGQDALCTSRGDILTQAAQAGYASPVVVGHVGEAPEPAWRAPLIYAWTGSWQGEGWGKFHLAVQGKTLVMFWYYGAVEGARFYGRYQLSADQRSAQGLAWGPPGREATYFRHELTFDLDSPQGPRLKLRSWRLAAPLDDGRLVSFVKPKESTAWLQKSSNELTPEEAQVLQALGQDPAQDPAKVMDHALNAARQSGRLLKR